MNNSVNYSSFVDLLLSSDDDYEPYGISVPPSMYGLRGSKPELYTRQEPLYFEDMDRWLSE